MLNIHLNYYLSSSGRFSRKKWWGYFLIAMFLNIHQIIWGFLFSGALFFTIITFGMGGSIMNEIPTTPNEIIQPFFGSLTSIISYFLFFIGAYLCIFSSIKRFHDRGKSGWWVLVGLLPGIGIWWILIECGFLKGTPGNNQFGSDPFEITTQLTNSAQQPV